MAKSLLGKIALVTGAASGLGKAIAQRMATDGATVAITDILAEAGREAAAADGFTFLHQDVCNEARWLEIMREIENRFGRLDILVNNAGILGPTGCTSPENARLENWRNIFAVNVEGTFLGCRAAITLMRKAKSGSIINISSVAGLMASPHATAYGASKAAVRQLTKSVAQHCAQERLGIRCNSVHPGNVWTTLWDNYAKEASEDRGISIEAITKAAKSIIPMGDFTLPEDVAAACSFLASDDSRHMTGTKLIVDGGIVNCDTFFMTRTP